MLFKMLYGFVVALKTTVRHASAGIYDGDGFRIVLYCPDKACRDFIIATMKTDVRFALTSPDKLGSGHSDWQVEGVPLDIRVSRVQETWDGEVRDVREG